MRRNLRKINLGLVISLLVVIIIYFMISIVFKNNKYAFEIALLFYIPSCMLISGWMDKLINKRISTLKENGILVKTNYVETKKIRRKSSEVLFDRYKTQYIVYSEGVNPISQKYMRFKSEEIWEDMNLYIQNNGFPTINVYIDKKNPRKYYMDLEFLKDDLK